ncbi:hypothetical protein ACFX2J_034243 [Malus domestica]
MAGDRALAHLKYACVGYSVFLDRNDTPADPHNKQAELPFCVGLEALYLHSYLFFLVSLICETRAMNFSLDEYLHRFKRNAALVASGVDRNVNRCTLFQLL